MDQYMKMAWLWNETNQYIENFKGEVDASRVMTVKSEDLFSDVETTRKLVRFCRLPEISSKAVEKIIRIPRNTKGSRQVHEAYKNWSSERKRFTQQIAVLASRYDYSF